MHLEGGLPDRDGVVVLQFGGGNEFAVDSRAAGAAQVLERVATIFEGSQQAGEHTTTWDASAFPSGVYFARLKTLKASQSIKMVLLK